MAENALWLWIFMILLKASEERKNGNPVLEIDDGFSTHLYAFNKSASDGKKQFTLSAFFLSKQMEIRRFISS